MADFDPSVFEERRKFGRMRSEHTSLAAADSLALPLDFEIDENDNFDPSVLTEQKKFGGMRSENTSLAAANSLAVPLDFEIDETDNFVDASQESLPPELHDSADSLALPPELHDSTASLALPPEHDIYAIRSFAEGSLAAADSLALPPDEEFQVEHAHPEEGEGKTKKRERISVLRRKISVLCILIFLLVGIVVLSVVLTKSKKDVGSTSQAIEKKEGSAQESMKDDNIFSTEPEDLPELYFFLESKVHDPAALLDINRSEGKAFNVLVEERDANKSTALSSIEDFLVQRYALLVLYFGTGGGGWTSTAGWSTRSEAYEEWYGVECSNSLVTGLELDWNNLSGKIPEDFCLMNGLKLLGLVGNTVELPSCLSKLSELIELDYRGNDYRGGLPRDLHAMPSLKSLRLSDNEFVGYMNALFPEAKSKKSVFPTLETLDLANNNLSGEIPESALRRLPSLDNLYLHGNPQLSGSLSEMCKGDDMSRIDADCDMVSCKCCTSGENCPSSLLPV